MSVPFQASAPPVTVRSKSVTAIVVGGRGDVAKTMVLPGLADCCGRIERLIVIDRRYKQAALSGSTQTAAYLEDIGASLTPEAIARLGKVTYVPGYATDPEALRRLDALIAPSPDPNVVVFFAIPPDCVGAALREVAMVLRRHPRVEFVIDKPFQLSPGLTEVAWRREVQAAQDLGARFLDHYNGKAAVRALANLFERHPELRPLCLNRRLACLSVSISEAESVGQRPHYVKTGACADMGNHLIHTSADALAGLHGGLQDPPADNDALRATALAALCRARPTEILLGQYDGFTEELGVDNNVRTETFFETAMQVDLGGLTEGLPPRSATVRLRTGKALATREATVTATYDGGVSLCVRIQPEPWVRCVGPDGFVTLDEPLVMTSLDAGAPYGVLIGELIAGSPRWFAPFDAVAAINGWTCRLTAAARHLPVHCYAPGSDGPVFDHSMAAE